MKTVTRLFDNYDDASDAVRELESTGIARSDISIVANNSDNWYDDDSSKAAEDAAGGAGLGAVVGGAGGLLTGLGIMAIPGVGPVVAAGWLVATAAGALAGAAVGGAAGGIVGALTDSGVPGKRCPRLRRGRAPRRHVGDSQGRRPACPRRREDSGSNQIGEPGRASG